MGCSRKTLSIHLRRLMISGGTVMLIGACTAVPHQQDWLTVGKTTRAEVVARYGQPDLVLPSSGGETAVYRPRDSTVSRPAAQIPMIQAGPLGTATTKLETINPGINAKPMNDNLQDRPTQELRIHYNSEGIVQQLGP